MTVRKKIFLTAIIIVIALFVFGLIGLFAEKMSGVKKSLLSGDTFSEKMGLESGAAPSLSPEYAADSRALSQTSYGDRQNDRMIIKKGYFSATVKDVKKTVDDIQNYVETQQGFIVSSNTSDDGEKGLIASVQFRIPQDAFEASLAWLPTLATKVTSIRVNGEDVSEEYSDVTTEIANLEATRDQFRKILEKATTVQDTLAVQRELSQIQGQIDQLKGRKKYLDESVKLSSVSVSLKDDGSGKPITPDNWRPGDASKDAIRSLINALKSLSYLAIWIIIFGTLWVPLLIIVMILVRWRRAKRKAHTLRSNGKKNGESKK